MKTKCPSCLRIWIAHGIQFTRRDTSEYFTPYITTLLPISCKWQLGYLQGSLAYSLECTIQLRTLEDLGSNHRTGPRHLLQIVTLQLVKDDSPGGTRNQARSVTSSCLHLFLIIWYAWEGLWFTHKFPNHNWIPIFACYLLHIGTKWTFLDLSSRREDLILWLQRDIASIRNQLSKCTLATSNIR